MTWILNSGLLFCGERPLRAGNCAWRHFIPQVPRLAVAARTHRHENDEINPQRKCE